jgi:uncharacterized protein YcfJ
MMNKLNLRRLAAVAWAAPALLAGCVSVPMAPTVAAMPPPNKPFQAFVADDQTCRHWAGGSAGQGYDAAANQMAASTIVGAVLGAATGALTGDSHDAAAGAAIGTLFGGSVGAQQSGAITWSAQRSYDIAYQQCMYARGNVIPGYNPYQPHLPAPSG